METIYRDYAPQGVKFYYIYKTLAHPGHHGYIDPVNLKERLLHVHEAKRTLGSKIPWICDTMANDLKNAIGRAPNCEMIIDPEGKMACKRGWSDPAQLRKDLAELVGPVARPTTVADLDLKTARPFKVAALGVLKPIEHPAGMWILATNIEAQPFDNQSYYVKLHAQADDALMNSGSGKLYLRFQLDQIYQVHWNNLTKPIQVKFQPPEGVTVTPARIDGPVLEEAADIDPREFLVDVRGARKGDSIRVHVTYFACNDDKGFCVAVNQTHNVVLQSRRRAR